MILSNNQSEKWNLMYFSPEGEKYSGTLIINNSKLIFCKDHSNADNPKEIVIEKEDISAIRETKKLICKSISISANGKMHIFAKNFLDTKKIIVKLKLLTKNSRL